jgi:DnaJ-class molecular chaperone
MTAPSSPTPSCESCKGSGEVPNTYPDCFVGGQDYIEVPDFIDCPDCKGTGNG